MNVRVIVRFRPQPHQKVRGACRSPPFSHCALMQHAPGREGARPEGRRAVCHHVGSSHERYQGFEGLLPARGRSPCSAVILQARGAAEDDDDEREVGVAAAVFGLRVLTCSRVSFTSTWLSFNPAAS